MFALNFLERVIIFDSKTIANLQFPNELQKEDLLKKGGLRFIETRKETIANKLKVYTTKKLEDFNFVEGVAADVLTYLEYSQKRGVIYLDLTEEYQICLEEVQKFNQVFTTGDIRFTEDRDLQKDVVGNLIKFYNKHNTANSIYI